MMKKMKRIMHEWKEKVSRPKNEDTMGEFRYFLRNIVFPGHMYEEKDCFETS